jgi:hypothetical protein
MPTVRIQTLDPEAVRFLTKKLVESGFVVRFAAPGEKASDDVDLELSVVYAKKSPRSLQPARRTAIAPSPQSQTRQTWTTPYHVDAPELGDESSTGILHFDAQDHDESAPSDLRQLARIIAGGGKRIQSTEAEIEVQKPDELPVIKAPSPAIQEPVQRRAPAVTAVRRRSVPVPSPVRAVTKPSRRVRSSSYRYAAIAAILVLAAAMVLFFLGPFAVSYLYQDGNSELLNTQPRTPSAPALQPTAPETVQAVSPAAADNQLASVQPESDTMSPLITHAKSRKAHRRTRVQRPVEEVDQPEVIVRRFFTTPED